MKTIGSVLKELRLEHNMTQGDISEKIQVSTAFWSSIESGKKPCPVEVVDKVAIEFRLTGKEVLNLQKLANISKREHKISVSGTSGEHQVIAAAFARKFKELNSEELVQLRQILEP